MQSNLLNIFLLIQLIAAFFLLFPLLNVVLSVFIKKEKRLYTAKTNHDLAIVITAYKDITIALPLVESILDQTYENYVVYLVADQCPVTGVSFKDERVKLLIPCVSLGSKVRSIKFACDNFVREHEFITVLDSDNLVHPDFLHITNEYLNRGYKAVQGRRTAKNVDTVYACLDAMGEYYYNYIVRYVPFGLGSSTSIAGSGMTISAQLYTDFFKNEEIENNFDKIIIAEDKILQADIIAKGCRIAFANEALVYDEKVSSGAQVERQRTRWINSYFKYAKVTIGFMAKGIAKLNWNQFYFGLNNFLPPLFLILLCSCFFLIADLFIDTGYSIFWAASLALFVLNFVFVLYLSNVEKEIWRSFWGIPMFMFNQVSALLKIKRSNQDFLVTEHTQYLTIAEVLERRGDNHLRKSKGLTEGQGKIKILETIRQGSFGGGETYLYNLVLNLNKDLYEPIVLSFTEGNMVYRLRENGIKTYVIENLIPYNILKFNEVKDIIRNEEIDIVHMHGTRAASNTLTPARSLGKKIIYTAHGWSFSSAKSSFSKMMRTLSEKSIVRNSDLCICGSQADIETGRSFGTSTEFELVNNSIDSEYFSKGKVSEVEKTKLRNELGIGENEQVVCFIGRIEDQKDPMIFVKAIPEIIKNYADVKFVMAGDGTLKAECVQTAKDLNVTDNIIFLPFRNDVRELLAISDFFILPSLWEVIPLALLEAMSMECCCIATDIEGTREAITSGVNGLLFNMHSVYELSDNIMSALKDKELKDSLSENARTKVVNNFDLHGLIAKNEVIYSKLMNEDRCMQRAALTG